MTYERREQIKTREDVNKLSFEFGTFRKVNSKHASNGMLSEMFPCDIKKKKTNPYDNAKSAKSRNMKNQIGERM